jgi:hypothetical protein
MNACFKRTAVTGLFALLVACGGGGGGATGPGFAGIEGSGFLGGAITGFGSVFVNGIELSTNAAQITIDGAAATESQLRVGQVVRVTGRIDAANRTGSAQTISAEDAVEGPVTARDLAANTLTVLGQPVRIDGATTFDSSIQGGLAGIAVGDFVEVYGFFNAAREVQATRIERKPAGGQLELTGLVQALDATLRRFQIGGITIDFAQAQLVNLPNGQVANGQLVEVKGTSVAGGLFAVTRVELVAANPTAANAAEVEGLITSLTSASDFTVGTQRVATTASTQFVNGTAANLAVNVKVEVEGAISNGVLTATKVEIKAGTNIRVTGTVDSVATASSSLVVLGVTVQVNALTRFEDQSSARVSPFNLGRVNANDYVEVRGAASGNTLTAVILERRNAENRQSLRAVAQNAQSPSFTLLGVTVQTVPATEFRDANDQSITAAQFFQLAPGRLVDARGARSGSAQLTAERLELEN